MESKLLLYIDTNIIVPVSCDALGRPHGTEPIYYSDNITIEHIKLIKDFYKETTGESVIDTHYVFAENLGISLKEDIIRNLSNEGIKPKSYTLLPSLILSEFVLRDNIAAFGEHVMIIVSNDESLKVTATVYDGSQWQWNGVTKIIEKVGSSSLKRCILECLINKGNDQGHIDDSNFENQVKYLNDFVDDWFAEYKNLDSADNLIVKNFKYSFEDTFKILEIPKREIERAYERTISHAMSAIIEYKKKKCNNSIIYAILVGSAFDESFFTSKVNNAVDCIDKFSVIPISKLISILKSYIQSCEKEDDCKLFEKTIKEKELSYKNNLEWIQQAQTLTELNEKLLRRANELTRIVSTEAENLDSIIRTTDSFLQKSNFQEAKESIGKKVFPSESTMLCINESRTLLADKKELEGFFERLNYIEGARSLIIKINANAERITDQINTVNRYSEDIKKRLERIDFCESHFDEYLDLKRVFKRTSDYKEMKVLVEKMKELSDESMPELTLRQVSAQISATKEKVKDGWFKKKSILRIHVSVKGEGALPCDALLNVSNKMRVRPSEGDADCLAFEIRKGQSSFTVQVDSTKCQLDFNTDLVCQLFTAVDVIDKKAIDCEPIIIK